MTRNKKVLLAQIKELLNGPQPERTIYHLDGIYKLVEKGVNKEISQDQAKALLDEDPNCRVFFIRIDPIKVPDFIQARVNPPRDQIIDAGDLATGQEFIDLITGREEF